jgi:hypothetical protein
MGKALAVPGKRDTEQLLTPGGEPWCESSGARTLD